MTAELVLSLILIWVCIRFVYRVCRGIAGAVLAVSRRHGEVPRNKYGRPPRPDIAGTPVTNRLLNREDWTQIDTYTKRAEGVPRP